MDIADLPSGEVEFVDDELEEVLERVSSDERISVLLRPVAPRHEFVEVLSESEIGEDCRPLAFASVVVNLSPEECEWLVEESLVEAIELNRPLTV